MIRVFDIDPSLNPGNDEDEDIDEHMLLAKYLKERILTIDLWNGESLMHFGTCKVPLSSLMRQGEPSKIVAQEYDICEPDYGLCVGGLQLLLTNEGRKIPLKAKDVSGEGAVGQKHKKKVLSKPIDSI